MKRSFFSEMVALMVDWLSAWLVGWLAGLVAWLLLRSKERLRTKEGRVAESREEKIQKHS